MFIDLSGVIFPALRRSASRNVPHLRSGVNKGTGWAINISPLRGEEQNSKELTTLIRAAFGFSSRVRN